MTEENKEKIKVTNELNTRDKEAAESLKRLVKSMLAAQGYTMERLADELNAKYSVKESKANLSNKFKRGSLRYIDMERIADVLGYKIEINKAVK